MASLTRIEARTRADLVRVRSYLVELDLVPAPTGPRRSRRPPAPVESFGSRTVIDVEAAYLGDTWLDLRATSLQSALLNGEPLDPATLMEGRLPITLRAGANRLEIEATMAFSRDGQGLHRAVDPEDGEAYVYGHLFLDAAPTVFACFDQPDLKAPYDITVRTPPSWVVIGNGPATSPEPGEWRVVPPAPLATYFVTICAGPYVSVHSEHDGIPLGLHARASLRPQLERWSDALFDVTARCFDYFHALFDIRYPFGEYHHVFVPEFNAAAMENPGCVTLRDQYLFRGQATDDEISERTNTIAHEMAHMWFGDLVTMRWWDDLWLNESLAEYLAYRASNGTGLTPDSWVSATIARKVWGYAAERAPSTHPVAGAPALDAQSALQDFDGISYAKGASVLRQLIAYIGDRAFIEGLREHLRSHSFGNATMHDFLGALGRAADRDLTSWRDAWLLTAGRDQLAAHLRSGTLHLTRTDPCMNGARAARPHTLDIVGYDHGRAAFRVEGTVDADSADFGPVPTARLVVPNAGDYTWADLVLDERSLAHVGDELSQIGDEQARAVLWVALMDGVAQARVDPMRYVDIVATAWPAQQQAAIVRRVGNHVVRTVLRYFVPPDLALAARHAVSDAATQLLRRAEESSDAWSGTSGSPGSSAGPSVGFSRGGGSSLAINAARFIAEIGVDHAALERWLHGEGVPAGLADDADFRWIVVGSMAEQGLILAEDIAAVAGQDSTMAGRLNALRSRASLPDPESKEWAWHELTSPGSGRANYELNALAEGFWHARDVDVVRPYVPRYFAELPGLAAWVGEDALATVADLAYPKVVEAQTLRLGEVAIADPALTPAVRRAMVDADWKIREAFTSRHTFA